MLVQDSNIAGNISKLEWALKGFFMCNLVVVLERDFAESVVSNNFSRVNDHIRGEQGLNRVIFKVDVYSACDSSDIE